VKKENGDEKFHWSRWKKKMAMKSFIEVGEKNGDEKFHWSGKKKKMAMKSFIDTCLEILGSFI
jgi:hypothetical protein